MFENLTKKQKRFSRLDGKQIDFRAYKDDAPSYPTTKVTSDGLYGSSTTNASGITYNPTDFEKSLVGTSQSGITNSLNQLTNPTYNSVDFNKYKSDLQGQQQKGFENNVVNPLLSRGLLGTSGVQNLSNMYGNTMNQQDSNLMDKFREQTLQNLNASARMYALPYDMMNKTSGLTTSLANTQYQEQMSKYMTPEQMWLAFGDKVSSAAGGAA